MSFFACCICCCVGPRMKTGFIEKAKEATGYELKSSAEYGEEFGAKLLANYYHGDKPGIEDVALYGTILAFQEAHLDCCDAFFANAAMQGWWERMSLIPALHPDKILSLTDPIEL